MARPVPDEIGLDGAGLDRVFAELRARGWRLVPQQLAQAHAMLAETRAAGADPSDISMVLAPILANSPEQQAEAQRRLAAVAGTAPPLPAVSADTIATGGPINAPTDVGGRAWPIVVLAGLVLLAVFVGFYFFHATPPEPTPTATAPAPATQIVPHTETETVVDPAYAALAAVLGLAPVALLAGWWLVQRRRSREGLGRQRDEASLDRLDLGARPIAAALFKGPELAPVARQWRRFQRMPTTELDPERTVMATIAAGGLFTPIQATRPTGSQYLLLIEEAGRHDHLARLADNLADRLADEGVAIQRFYHADGLELLRAADRDGGGGARLVELPASPRGTVVLIGSGAALFDPLTATPDPMAFGELARWSRRALLSTRPIAEWGDREEALVRAGYALATATDSGVAALGRHIARGFPQHLGLLEGLREAEDEPLPVASYVAPPLASRLAELRAQVAAAEALASGERAGLLASIREMLDQGEIARALDRLRAEPGALIDAPRLLAALRAHFAAGETEPELAPEREFTAEVTAAVTPADRDDPPSESAWSNRPPLVINRAMLREFVEAQVAGRDGQHVLFVEGPSRSGLSFTAELARRIAGDRLPIMTANFESVEKPDALTLARLINPKLGGSTSVFEKLRPDSAPLAPIALARVLVETARERAGRTLVIGMFRDQTSAGEEFWEFVRALIDGESPFSLIFVNSRAGERFPQSQFEYLYRFTEHDIAEAIIRANGSSADQLDAAVRRVIEEAGGEKADNADIAALVAQVIRSADEPIQPPR